jgi:hypothetical protein
MGLNKNPIIGTSGTNGFWCLFTVNKYISNGRKRSLLPSFDLCTLDGDQRRVPDRKALLCWQVISMIKKDGYFLGTFTEKRLRNLFIEEKPEYAQ